MERFKKYFGWLPQTKQDWLFAEKWGLLTLVAFVVAFGLFLQCGGVFFYGVEDCADFTSNELSVIRSEMSGRVNSASDCARVNKWMIEWYRLRTVKDSMDAEALMSRSKACEDESKKAQEKIKTGQKCISSEKAREGRAFISMKELQFLGKKPCMFVAYDNSLAWYGPEARGEIRRYGSGYFPVLERLSNGLVKTVDRLDAPDGWYAVVYLSISALSSKWEKTAFGIHQGHYDITPNVPELCPLPEEVKKKG